MASTVFALLGQLGMAVVLDYVFFQSFHFRRVIGIFLILAGIAWREQVKVQKPRKYKREETA